MLGFNDKPVVSMVNHNNSTKVPELEDKGIHHVTCVTSNLLLENSLAEDEDSDFDEEEANELLSNLVKESFPYLKHNNKSLESQGKVTGNYNMYLDLEPPTLGKSNVDDFVTQNLKLEKNWEDILGNGSLEVKVNNVSRISTIYLTFLLEFKKKCSSIL